MTTSSIVHYRPCVLYNFLQPIEAWHSGVCLMNMCLYSVPGPSGQVGGGGDLTLPMVLMGWVVIALVLFLLRPSSLRGPQPTGKPSGPHNVSISCIFQITNIVCSHLVTAPPWFAWKL